MAATSRNWLWAVSKALSGVLRAASVIKVSRRIEVLRARISPASCYPIQASNRIDSSQAGAMTQARDRTASTAAATAIQDVAERVKANIRRVIVGKDDVIDLVLVALFSEGHLLIEDVPGIGKTTLAKSIARSIGCTFRRIQFTPDVMPTDITGLNFYNQKQGEFEFRPGPIIANIVLADEINRATPRTQSALLEAMEERQVTVEGTTMALPQPFLVIATQNPIELEGTFPLPEAQLDRFFMKVELGYPDEADEEEILVR